MRFPKRGRVRLDGEAYKALCEQVLTRDEWRCRRCSSRAHLQVHHIIKRSELRLDLSWNLVTLCAACHELVERHEVQLLGQDADLPWDHPEALRFQRV